MYKKEFMEIAVSEARKGFLNGDGGPFGAVIVKDGEVVASGHNQVLKNNDSTCHGEIDAIRKAEQKLQTYDLSGCQIYTTGEPCGMCLAAILWANIDKVYYGCSLKDNEKIGFRDDKIDKLLDRDDKLYGSLLEQKEREECLKLFKEYKKSERVIY
ncbi:nucleoside deaminase [Candidatus Saccharibacteria bacterium]|nr:nucleoside deaminase [Candidatus Saccharibacteria bacterium]